MAFRWGRRLGPADVLGFDARLEAPVLLVGFDDVAVMGECCRDLGITEDARPRKAKMVVTMIEVRS